MKIAVLGATGFVGRTLCAQAAARGHSVRALGRAAGCDAGSGYVRTDYFDLSSLRRSVAGADAVVCLAAARPFKGFGTSDYLGNISIAANALEACRLEQVHSFVFTSSQSVYSGAALRTEDADAAPVSLYGESKLASEHLCGYYSRVYGMKTVSLRCAQVLGWGEHSGYMLNTFLEQAASRQTLTVFGEGISERQYIYVEDLADAILCAAAGAACGVFNIAMDETISVRELALLINAVFGNEGNLAFRDDPNEDRTKNRMSVEKARSVLGWTARRDMRGALLDMKRQREKIPE